MVERKNACWAAKETRLTKETCLSVPRAELASTIVARYLYQRRSHKDVYFVCSSFYCGFPNVPRTIDDVYCKGFACASHTSVAKSVEAMRLF